jgi:hypothetical protein
MLSSRLTVAVVALAIGIAATAGAAKMLTGKDIKNGTITKKDLAPSVRALLGVPGPQGPAGPKGDTGATGAQGTAGTAGVAGADGQSGQSGSSAPALLFTNGGLDNASARWMAPGIGGASASETQVPLPAGVGLNARDLTVSLVNAPGGGKSFTFTFRKNGVDTALACQVSGTDKTCTSPSNQVIPLVAGDLMSIRATPSGTPTTGVANLSMRIVF